MDIHDFISPSMYPGLMRLGKVPGWFAGHMVDPQEASEIGCNVKFRINYSPILEAAKTYPVLTKVCDYLREMQRAKNWLGILFTENLAAFGANGPKFFIPTLEQWESFENVELRIPLCDYASPFPGISVRIPEAAARRLATEFEIPWEQAPRQVMVRWRSLPGEPVTISAHVGKRGQTTEGFFFIGDYYDNRKDTIESLIGLSETGVNFAVVSREDDPRRPDGGTYNVPLENYARPFYYARTAARAAMNLCLWLTQTAHTVRYPVDPEKARNRAERREFTRRLEHDFAAIEMRQTIIIRQALPPSNNLPGPGTGIELKPHWRKGHWRAYPGQAKLRADGKVPQLLFVKPTLVRRDRMTGDEGDTQVTYRGAV